MDCFAIPQTLGYPNMEILIFFAATITVLAFNFIYDKYKMINTPKNKHRCFLPRENYLTFKNDWQCKTCKAYWYVKYDKWGSHYVKRE
jgi:hypothetical protein